VLALIDWRILANAQATVYFTESSFGYEAAIASGNFDQSVALAPNSLVSLGVQVRGVVQNLLGAPKRRGWL
jgi:3-polyprenyl-4-hydroxybenzoate decarboxylase